MKTLIFVATSILNMKFTKPPTQWLCLTLHKSGPDPRTRVREVPLFPPGTKCNRTDNCSISGLSDIKSTDP